MTKQWALSARISGRRFTGLMMAGATALSLLTLPAQAEGPLLTPKTGVSKQFLTVGEVGKIIAQVVQEAKARHRPATIAVVDRLGAVLAIYRMTGAPKTEPVESNPKGPNAAPILGNGLSGASVIPTTKVPIVATEMEALTKAITAAYLSTSHGNAFTTRTASQIVQDHYNPGTENAASGPLFGVQFSSLPCSDMMVRFSAAVPTSETQGPHRSPLGLAGDPGGLPLYKGGELVGGIGVKAEGPYRVDEDIYDNDHSTDEIEALAGTHGFEAPTAIRADHITAGGLTLRFSDAQPGDLLTNPAKATPWAKLTAADGALLPMLGYFEPLSPKGHVTLRKGSPYGSLASGIVQDTTNTINATKRPYLLVDAKSHVRYPAIAGTGTPDGLTKAEALQLLRAAYASGIITRAQIRNPAGSPMAVTISVVDANGTILGVATIPDAPVFGIDVSLQKARSAVFMSSAYGDSAMQNPKANASILPGVLPPPEVAKFSKAATAFFGRPVFSGAYAWGARAIGNVDRDTYPDGIDNTVNGPLSLAYSAATPFSDGLQLNMVLENIANHIAYVEKVLTTDTPAFCTYLPPPPASSTKRPVLSNGLQVFPGGFPVYRNGKLVGGVGISGDGVDQDDMTAFLGIYNAGKQIKTGIGEAPFNIRASVLNAHGAGPHYVNCPYAPYVGSNSQNLCIGK